MSSREFVIAIDIGTAFSGYAFSSSLSGDASSLFQISALRDEKTGGKVPTALLLEPNGTFSSFGRDAIVKYGNFRNGEELKWMFFHRFKMELHSETNLSRGTKIRAANGKSQAITTVFSLAIKHLRDAAFHAIRQNLGLPDKTDPLVAKYVITVPAIWSDGSKQIMREAAYEAGLASSDDKVEIVLEPEAAAVYCKFAKHLPDSDDDSLSEAYASGKKFILADLGGGTADITVHSVRVDKRLREILPAAGVPWGGTHVDEEYIRLIERIFGKHRIKEFKTQFPSTWIDFILNFDAAKRRVKDESLRVALSMQFFEFMEENDIRPKQCIKDFPNEHISYHRGDIMLDYPEVKKLFEPVIKPISAKLQLILRAVENVAYVILVGGFATSQMLVQRLKDDLQAKHSVRVLVGREPSLAVVMGAVLLGYDPSQIASRRVKYTYGISHRAPFDKGRDPETHFVIDEDGEKKCINRFQTFVEKGDEMTTGQEVTHEFVAPSAKSTSVSISVFSSSDILNPRYITDVGVRKVAEMTLPMPNTEGGKSRKLTVTMSFGKTEIKVVSEAISSGTKAKMNVHLDFLGHSE